MKKKLYICTILFCLLTAFFIVLFLTTKKGVYFTLSITMGTTAYHFAMRLSVGLLFDATMKNRADYTKKWYQTTRLEDKIYRALGVKKWKKRMPTYEPSYFNPKIHTWEEIAQAMCEAELVHETIIPLSFLPMIAAIWVGALPVFLITSVLAALIDVMSVMIQRYNRPRVIRHIEKIKQRTCDFK